MDYKDMTQIDHLSPDERKHYIKCDCGHYIDMRDLGDVFNHLHAGAVPKAQFKYSTRVGEPSAYTNSGKRVDLN